MQAIYFPKKPIALKKDEEFLVKCCHDEYSLWFDTSLLNGQKDDFDSYFPGSDELPLSLPTIVSRNRLSQLNDPKRSAMLLKLLSEVFDLFINIQMIFGLRFRQSLSFQHSNQDKRILVVNDDFSLLGLMAAKRLSFSKVLFLHPIDSEPESFALIVSS